MISLHELRNSGGHGVPYKPTGRKAAGSVTFGSVPIRGATPRLTALGFYEAAAFVKADRP